MSRALTSPPERRNFAFAGKKEQSRSPCLPNPQRSRVCSTQPYRYHTERGIVSCKDGALGSWRGDLRSSSFYFFPGKKKFDSCAHELSPNSFAVVVRSGRSRRVAPALYYLARKATFGSFFCFLLENFIGLGTCALPILSSENVPLLRAQMVANRTLINKGPLSILRSFVSLEKDCRVFYSAFGSDRKFGIVKSAGMDFVSVLCLKKKEKKRKQLTGAVFVR